jgi:F-type H+-transporting ATPase subunit b
MLATLLAEGAQGAKEVINPVLPVVPELIWGAVFFFTLLILMKFVLLPPVKAGMRRREEQVRNDLEAAEKARSEADGVRRDYDATLAEARAEAGRIIDESRQAAETKRAAVLAATDAETGAQRHEALAEIDAQRQSAMEQLRPLVGDIAVQAASKVVQRPVDPAQAKAAIDAYVDAQGGIGGAK